MEAREEAAHGLHGQSEMVRDVVSRHAEIEFMLGKPPPTKALREVEQKTPQPFLGILLTKHLQQRMVAGYLSRKQPVDRMIEPGALMTELLEPAVRHYAHASALKRYGGTAMPARLDGIKSNQLPR